ncbi:MAG: TetR/AcrR family transcriptional regulator [Lachnospiraceae bacterium]
MKENHTLSKQQLKSKETKDRIFQAAKNIMKKSGYEALSIKNICEEANVSNGSFYHHFKTKDDLLSYYIEDQPSMDSNLLDIPQSLIETKETIIKVYLNYATYCKDLGVDFMASYYTPKNQALNPHIRTERPYPIITVQAYLEKAIAANIVQTDLKIDEITTDIRMLVIGNVFEWCLNDGNADFDGNIRRSLGKYLEGILH